MTQPSIIGSSQPHTVTLAPGSQTATHKQPRVSTPTPPAPPAQFVTGTRAAAAAPKVATKAAADARPLTPPEPSPEPDPASMLGPDILMRISRLQEHNDNVRAELDRLPVLPGPVR